MFVKNYKYKFLDFNYPYFNNTYIIYYMNSDSQRQIN